MIYDSVKNCDAVCRSKKTMSYNESKLKSLLREQEELHLLIEKEGENFNYELNKKLSLVNHKIEVTKTRCEAHVSVYCRRNRFENWDTHTKYIE